MIINKKLQYRLLTRNTFFSYLDGISFSFLIGSSFPYIGLYILRFHGSADLVGLVSGIQPLTVCLMTLLTATLVNSFKRKKPILLSTGMITRLFVLGIAFVPLLPEQWRAPAFFGMWIVTFIPWSVMSLAWSAMIANMIPDENQSRFFGTRNAITGITGLIGTFLSGLILAEYPFSHAFMGIFGGAFLLSVISLFSLMRHMEPVVPAPGEIKTLREPNVKLMQLDLAANFQTFRHPDYGAMFSLTCIAMFVFHIGFSMTIPLYTLRQVQQLGYSNATIGLFATVSGLTALCGSYAGGLASERWGYRYVLLVSTLTLVIWPILWAVSSSLPLLLLATGLGGFLMNAYYICFFFMVLAVSPYENRSRFVAMNTVVGNSAGAIGPLAGLLFIKIPWLGIQGTLLIAAAIMLLGAVLSFQVAKKGTF